MSTQTDPCLHELPTSEVIGLSFTALAGFISCLAVLFVLFLVGRNYIRNVRHPPPGGEWRLIRTHVDAYLLSLLASDMLQGLGAVLNVQWAAQRRSYCSATCTAQGFIQQIGETGVAMGTFAIALQTFLVIFFRWSPSKRSAWVWKVVIAFIWLYVIIFAAVGYGLHHTPANNAADVDAFFTPTPYWCWISGHFNAERIAGEYFWLWLAAFASIALYLLLFFRVRGNIEVDPHNWTRIRVKLRRWTDEDGLGSGGDGFFAASGGGARGGDAGKTAAKEAMSMIWYPVTYTLLVLPLSIVRWSTFRPPGRQEPHVPFAVTSVVIFIFSSSGLVNVVLMLLTRKNLLLFGQRGVVNPARIGPAAQARLNAVQARMNRHNNNGNNGNGNGNGNGPNRHGGDDRDRDDEADVGMRRIVPDDIGGEGGKDEEQQQQQQQMEGPGGMTINEKNSQKRGSLSGRIRAVVGLSALTGHLHHPNYNRPSSAKSKEREESTDDTTSGEQNQQQQQQQLQQHQRRHDPHRFGFGFGHRNHRNDKENNKDGGNNNKDRDRDREEREYGDTSFAAGGFTTQAFETERSFELGSAKFPSPINSPISPVSLSGFGFGGGGIGGYPPTQPQPQPQSPVPPPPSSHALPSFAISQGPGRDRGRQMVKMEPDVDVEADVEADAGETYDSALYGDLASKGTQLEDAGDSLGRVGEYDDGDYGIQEGMSRHLGGSLGEYDVEREKQPVTATTMTTTITKKKSTTPPGALSSTSTSSQLRALDRLYIPQDIDNQYSNVSTQHSNFLDLDPSRSNVGADSSVGVVPSPNSHSVAIAGSPSVTLPLQYPPTAHLPRDVYGSHPLASQPATMAPTGYSPMAYNISTGEGGIVAVGSPISEGRRGSAVSKVSQTGSMKSRGSVSGVAPKASVDIYDYSVPMKFNPTPPQPPPVPLEDSNENELSRSHSRSPFGSKSRNTSSKSLHQSGSKTSLRKSGSKSVIGDNEPGQSYHYQRRGSEGRQEPITPSYHYQRRGSEGTNEPSSSSITSKTAPWTSLTTLFSSKGDGHTHKRESLEPPVPEMPPRRSIDRSTRGRNSSSYGPSPPGSAQSESRLIPKRSGDLTQYKMQPQQQQQPPYQRGDHMPMNWPRASGSSTALSSGGGPLVGGRRPSATQTDEEMHAAYRPNTGGSTRSYRSYTFGPPGISSSSPVPPPAGAVDPMYDEGALQLRSRGQKPGTDSYKDQDIGRAL